MTRLWLSTTVVCVTILLKLLHNVVVCELDYTIDKDYGITWMYFPDGDGNMQIASLKNDTIEGRSESPFADMNRSAVHFELYTRRHQQVVSTRSKRRRKRQKPDLDEFNAYFEPSQQTKILIHGWQSDTQSEFVQSLKDNYLQSRDCNVIAVVWNSRSINYPLVAASTKNVGRVTALLIDYLHEIRGSPMELIHIIGHSLGAHTAGFAGLYSKYRVARITGLDPALPGFASATTSPDHRLDATDAEFVDVIHSGSGLYSVLEPVGDVDFYPNSGRPPQPGCGLLEKLDACSHGRAYVYFGESILSTIGFWGHSCSSWPDFVNDLCPVPTALMGDPVPESSRGLMYLRTNDRAPFALGYV